MKKTILFFTMIASSFSGFSQSPVLSISQPTCFSPFGTVEVISPLSNAGPTAQNLYISEVTDADLGGLSYIEIYNETVTDLLQENSSDLMILEHGEGDVHVAGLSQIHVDSFENLVDWIKLGNRRRKMAKTN